MSKVGSPEKLVALIAGPTASGKSDCAVKLALSLRDVGTPAVVINADSAQVYRDLHVLSARPTEEEMQGVPHHLFGAWDAAEACSAADWAAAAKREIENAHLAGAVPILVGGTGLYIRTLLDGIAPIPEIDPEVREQVRAMPVAEAYAALAQEDPASAEALAPGDSQRIARALEVVRATGRTLGTWQREKVGGIGDAITLAPLVLLPDREWLYERCDRRFVQMLDQGAVEEVEALLARDLSPDLPAMRAIGVPQIAAMLRGELSREETIELGQRATRQYAKRQYTWLRHQPPTDWPRVQPENVSIKSHFGILFSN
ncbi:tRNA (adenosine(37)-N6)-dimethylallyltransferase MiaA [Aurantiacibacter sp. MUD11]|uniref:tRNA (adenosine(37)-N6)-dimethylallyltransferase MiaA n=1 Tax=Aurantiacibacter sp. MUD11 TaxID=3003265 RepID=UPI0022AB2723|nr:tRNA (adenosine(37)-N6)-dimethylallyltransferase MiaA [Aurantiacibacter sp. MUD11]WAT18257.1 tRNA (adenosine(37)-N6)-dimethylallyltransferase MiaA [Aurantiacibacter sp. MUD11]